MSRDLETCGKMLDISNAGIIRVPEEKKERSGQKKYLKKNHRQSLHKYGEAQQVQTKKPRGSTPENIIVKVVRNTTTTGKILKTARGKMTHLVQGNII